MEHGNDEELNDIELSPFGIHWNQLDEDLSFVGIMRGDYAQAGRLGRLSPGFVFEID